MTGRGRGRRRSSETRQTLGTQQSTIPFDDMDTRTPHTETPTVQATNDVASSSHAADVTDEARPTGATNPSPHQPSVHDTPSDQGIERRFLLTMIGDTFSEQSKVTRCIMQSLKGRYEGAWPTWTSVPAHVKDVLWTEFSRTFSWFPVDAIAVRRAWSLRIGKRISQEFSEARKGGYCPKWLKQEFWDEMCQNTFSTQKFKNKCAAAQKNRKEGGGTGVGLSTCGSISIVEIEARLEKEKGRKIYSDEAFAVSHQLQKDKDSRKKGDFVDEKAAQVFASFQESFNEASQQASTAGSQVTPPQREQLFLEAAGGKNKKGRVYGVGSKCNTAGCSTDFSSAFTKRPSCDTMREDVVEEIRAQLQQEFDQHLQQRVDRQVELRVQQMQREIQQQMREFLQQSTRLMDDSGASFLNPPTLGSDHDDNDDDTASGER